MGLGVAGLLIGVFIFCSPHPVQMVHEHKTSARRITRVCTVVALASLVLLLIPRIWFAPPYVAFGLMCLSPVGFPGIIGASTYRTHLCEIARRAGAPRLQHDANTCFAAIALAWSMGAASGLIAMSGNALAAIGCVCGAALLVFVAFGILLLGCTGAVVRELQADCRQAYELWHRSY